MGTPSAPGAHQEPVRARITGVGEPLPAGEALLWEGRPDLSAVAFRVLHLRLLIVYWGVVAAGFAVFGVAGGRGGGAIAADLAWLIVVGLLGSGVLFLLAAAIRKSTTYALTNRRVVIRLGMAFPSVLNLPLRRIDAVDYRPTGRRHGEVVLSPAGDDRVGWLYLWPHAQPWAFRDPKPAFRALPDADEVGRLVAREVARARSEDREDPDRAFPVETPSGGREAAS
jgi:hypothetical protein